MLSFGKDSMALAHLIRAALSSYHGHNGHFPSVHAYPLPVIYHRDPWFPVKHEFAENTARSWGMEVHDFLPACAGIKVNDKLLELVARYPFGESFMDLPKNVSNYRENPRRDYICGLNDWIHRPKAAMMPYNWTLIFHGHKSSDVDPFEGNVRLKDEMTRLGLVYLVFPLKDWTDEDVWDYIEEHHIPLEVRRYQGRHEVTDHWYNNDYLPACTNCIDPRNKEPEVFCPKLRRNVKNVSDWIMRLRAEPHYLETNNA
jgi:3'-phosphoadenosine 5'-phosphosulfate sulfotransferase (PAPS reductase)/FAD synthetase